MQKILDLEFASQLLMEYHLRRGIFTNNFLSAERRNDGILSGNLFYTIDGENLYLFERRNSFYRMYFDILSGLQLPEDMPEDMPVICETGLKPGDESTKKNIEKLLSHGFKNLIVRERMQRDSFSGKLDTSGAVIAQTEDLPQIMKLLTKNFDEYTGCLLNEKELLRELRTGHIYKAYTDNRINGFLHFAADKKGFEIKHIAVDERARRLGVATKLMHKCTGDLGVKSNLWVTQDNESAKSFYIKNGYSFDNWKSYVMIYNK